MEDTLKRRFFYDQSFAIYGGITGQYDFGYFFIYFFSFLEYIVTECAKKASIKHLSDLYLSNVDLELLVFTFRERIKSRLFSY